MGNRSGRFRHDTRALSPQRALLYWAVIPLLCTLMLALPLGYYTSTTMKEGTLTVPSCNIQLQTTDQGNWTLTVFSGRLDVDRVTIQVHSDINGTPLFYSALNGSSGNFTWNDNNQNGRFDGGDILLINQTGIHAGSTVELYYDTVSFFHGELAARGRR